MSIHTGPVTPAADNTLRVQGHGEIAAAPDRATIMLGVQSQDKDAQAAMATNTSRMMAVINAIKVHGVEDEDIRSTNLSLQFHQDQKAYIAMHQLSVGVREVDRIGAVLDAAVSVGANASWGVSFGLEDPSVVMAQALHEAVANARERANSIAHALGVTLVGVVSAAQLGHGGGIAVGGPAMVRRMASAAHTPVQTGELTIAADVEVVYAIG